MRKSLKKRLRTMYGRWKEAGVMIAILIFAGLMTIFRPFDGGTVGYFSDVITPMILIVGVLFIIAGIRMRVS